MLDYDKHQRHLVTVFSVIPLLLSFLGLANWLLRALTPLPGISALSAFAPTTLLSLFVISVLIMLRGYFRNLRWSLLDFLLLGLILIYCINVLLSVFWISQLRPEELTINQNNAPKYNLLAPMSPLSAIFLIFISISYLTLINPFFQDLTKRRFSSYFSLIVFGGVSLVILTHLSKVKMLPVLGLVPMSMLTAISVMCISLALLETVDLGLLRVLHYVSGNTRDKVQPLNQLNAFIYLFIVATTVVTTVLLLQGQRRDMKQNLREQILLNLDSHKNVMNIWLQNHYNTAKDVIYDQKLTQGMVDIFEGNSRSEDAQYARYWGQIIQGQHRNIRLAIYDPISGKQKSFSDELIFSPQELKSIMSYLNSGPEILVQSTLSNMQNPKGDHEIEFLRYWVKLSRANQALLFLVELQPNNYIRQNISKSLSGSQTSHNHIFCYENSTLYYISEPVCLKAESSCNRLRGMLNVFIDSQGLDFAGVHYAHTYNNKGAEVYFAAVKLDYLPWIMAQSLDSTPYLNELARWSWFFTGISILLFLGLAFFMHQFTRRKTIRDDKIALQEWLNTFNAVPSAIWLMDVHGTILRSNNTITQLFGIKESDILGKNYQAIIPSLPAQLDSELLKMGLEVHSEFGHNNRWYDSSIAPILDASGNTQNYVQIISDITEKKENIHRLEASEIRFRAIFDQSPIGISIISSDLLYLSTNSSFVHIFGYEEQELLGMSLTQTAHPDFGRQIETGIRALLEGRTKFFRQETRFICKGGNEIWGLLICILISDSSLEGDFILAMVENIQDRVQAMQELYRAKEMAVMSERLKSSFMQNISHEFRTPLNGILGFSQVLKTGNTIPEEVKEYADSIYQSGKRMHQLIANIMSFAKVDSGQENLLNNPFSLKQMLNKIYDLYKSRALNKNLDLVCELPPEYNESILISDESKILQILAKLMDNAIGFTERGSVKCQAHLEMNTLVLQVIDTGIGIPEEKQSRIFESFYQADMSFTRKHDGVGLGLSICKGLAEILKGDIKLNSQVNVGTTFTVRIPVTVHNQ